MIVRAFAGRELWSVQKAWREVFARRLHRKTGRWIRGGADRYLFHPEYVSVYLTGAAAEGEYSTVRAESVIIVDEDACRGELHSCGGGAPPPLSDYLDAVGVVIFPPTYDWTVVTGPDEFDRVCFTYRDWVERSNGIPDEEDAAR